MQREGAASLERVRPGGRELVNRVLVFVALAAFIAAVYASIALGLAAVFNADTPNAGLSVLATSVVAITFARFRRRAQRFANRITYGERAMPEEVLARFSEQVATSYAPDEALPRVARAVAEGTGATHAEVWVRVDDAMLLAAGWPSGKSRRRARVPIGGSSLPAFSGADRVAPVRHQDELLGAITIAKRAGEQVTASEEQLLADLATQAGPVLRNVALTADLAARLEEIEGTAAELRASRQRIVAAQDAERRRLERDIHDGAQQHLVALAVKLRMARTFAERDPVRASPALADVRGLIDGALTTLRDLSRGIYPPVLAEQGLVPALRAHAGGGGVRITVTSKGVGRLEESLEAAIYFCCLEAIQNAAKHGARKTVVKLGCDGPDISFEVTDDGPGFDPRTAKRGSGLQNMADRIAAAGGRLQIVSSPGAGTTISGTVPAREPRP
jgi:signal transduction histidine kinase